MGAFEISLLVIFSILFAVVSYLLFDMILKQRKQSKAEYLEKKNKNNEKK